MFPSHTRRESGPGGKALAFKCESCADTQQVWSTLLTGGLSQQVTLAATRAEPVRGH
jgi:hypothetical protein